MSARVQNDHCNRQCIERYKHLKKHVLEQATLIKTDNARREALKLLDNEWKNFQHALKEYQYNEKDENIEALFITNKEPEFFGRFDFRADVIRQIETSQA